jgi:hypothetical protein
VQQQILIRLKTKIIIDIINYYLPIIVNNALLAAIDFSAA